MKVYYFKKIYTKTGILNNAYLCVEGNKIIDILKTRPPFEVLDYSEYIALPGIIDIHSHGCMGYSATCTLKDDLIGYLKAIAATGVTGVLPTTQEFEAFEIISSLKNEDHDGAEILGIQAEGPFRSLKFMGASKGLKWPSPSVDYARKMVEAAKGNLKYMSVSAEVENAEAIIKDLVNQGIRVAGGHSDATYKEAKESFNWGVSSISHFGNALRKVHQREGGIAIAALLEPEVYIEMIADYVHLSPEIVEAILKIKDHRRIILMSDSNELAYMPKGKYFARDKERYVDEYGNITIEDGTISGSGKSILYGIKNLVFKANHPLEEVIKWASLNPATYFGLSHKGSIQIGNDADFIITNEKLELKETISLGRSIYDSSIDPLKLVNPKMNNLI